MYKLMQHKNKNQSNSQSLKKQRPKPEWTTDFIDREQYKLSQVQRIQKKASLQSKNRQQAKRQLQQRRKKLQMGIIDQETRKIYQTALTAKNIDINPPLRRNLTEMIKYERQQRQRTNQENYNQNGEQNQEDMDQQEISRNQLKEAQNFIKKFQRAKKQQKIQRAVQILSNNHSIQNQRQTMALQTKTNNFLRDGFQSNSGRYKNSLYSQNKSNKSDVLSQDEAISSIQDTIRFMEEKLFMAKKTVDQHSKSFISQANESFDNDRGTATNFQFQNKQTGYSTKYNFKKPEKVNKTGNQKFQPENILDSQQDLDFGNKMGEISQLRIKFKEQNESQSDDQCLETIRRMRQLLDNHESYDERFENKKMKQNIKDNFMIAPNRVNAGFDKKNIQSAMDSEAEVSFNLTINDEQFQPDMSRLSRKQLDKKYGQRYEQNQFVPKVNKRDNQNQKKIIVKQEDEQEDEYEKVKQNLFLCISSDNQKQPPNFTKTTSQKPSAISKFQQSSKNYGQDSDDEQGSEDSLLVQNKINMWKKEFQHQADPSDEDQQQQIVFKRPTKTQMKVQQQYEDDEEDQDQNPYKNNVFSHQTTNQGKTIQQNNRQAQPRAHYKPAQQAQNKPTITKKPPLARKNPSEDKFQEIKKMISNASTQIQKLEIQPLKIQSMGTSPVMGFDFRGSLNIKKNIK